MTLTKSGVPVGIQVATLSCSSTGCPIEVTRTAAVVHCAVAQGGCVPDVIAGNVQPAMEYGLAIVTIACPDTVTRGFGATGVAIPAWAHITAAPECSRNPGIVGLGYVTFSAPWFTSVTPTRLMVAAVISTFGATSEIPV